MSSSTATSSRAVPSWPTMSSDSAFFFAALSNGIRATWLSRSMSSLTVPLTGIPSRSWRDAVLLGQDSKQHLIGATADREQPGIAEVARHPGLLHVADT